MILYEYITHTDASTEKDILKQLPQITLMQDKHQ